MNYAQTVRWAGVVAAMLLVTLAQAAAENAPATSPSADAAGGAGGAAIAAVPGEPRLHSGSRSPYIHQIQLYDATGKIIDAAKSDQPWSPMATCGKCHDTETISHGWHFNAADPNAKAGRPGEPWILTDAQTRTELPVSARQWPGTFSLAEAKLTPWQFVQNFGRQMPGGGLGDRFAESVEDPAARFKVAGKLEVNCMLCHAADHSQNPADWARQIEMQNLKWAPSGSSNFATVKGDARKIPEDYDPDLDLGDNPDVPKVVYNKSMFDSQNRVRMDLTRRVPAENCYYCHTVRDVGPSARPRWQHDGDVHLAAGLTCVDCHRAGLEHKDVRGYEGEADDRKDAKGRKDDSVVTLSCRGCHLGDGAAPVQNQKLGGRLGSPRPQHKGLPPLHFDKLSCTACHSGPWPAKNAMPLQTSMAHALGISSENRTWQTPPSIVAPVFMPDQSGRIAPHRMMWPAYWGRMNGGQITPLGIAEVKQAAGSVLKEDPDAKTEGAAFSDETIGKAIEALNKLKGEGEIVYVRDGWVFRRGADGKVASESNASVRPYAWPMAHDVRPAAQALGSNGCTDCHSADSAFFFGTSVAAQGPQSRAKPLAMYEMQKVDPTLQKAWGLSFQVRPFFKYVAFACLGIIALVLLANGLAGLNGLLKAIAGRK